MVAREIARIRRMGVAVGTEEKVKSRNFVSERNLEIVRLFRDEGLKKKSIARLYDLSETSIHRVIEKDRLKREHESSLAKKQRWEAGPREKFVAHFFVDASIKSGEEGNPSSVVREMSYLFGFKVNDENPMPQLGIWEFELEAVASDMKMISASLPYFIGLRR